ncbi:MAG: hypothetical protein KGI54_14905 [Pseudomonadota bacterium]|nr:hypothetical protein [Pseudomonadota bacterium]
MAKKEFVLPTSPVDLKVIQDAIIEASNSMVRSDAEKDLRKDIAGELKEKLEVPPAFFNKLVKVYHKATYDQEVSDADAFQHAYEAILKDKDPSLLEE